MKKVIFTVIILLMLLAAEAGMDQNLDATKQYLETQLEIIRLQSTIFPFGLSDSVSSTANTCLL